jgi:hypothetical protein
MTEETQEYWSLDELESLTETVQEAKVEYQGKHIKLSWCELTESEEPKAMVLDENLPEDEKNAQFLELAREKTKAMMKKAQDKQPDKGVLSVQVYDKLPAAVKFTVSNKILGIADPNEQ